MTDTTRDLIQRLVGELQEWIDYAPIGPCDDEQALIDEARAYLAQPELEGPTNEELQELLYYEFTTSTGHGERSDPIGFARAVLARWGK